MRILTCVFAAFLMSACTAETSAPDENESKQVAPENSTQQDAKDPPDQAPAPKVVEEVTPRYSCTWGKDNC